MRKNIIYPPNQLGKETYMLYGVFSTVICLGCIGLNQYVQAVQNYCESIVDWETCTGYTSTIDWLAGGIFFFGILGLTLLVNAWSTPSNNYLLLAQINNNQQYVQPPQQYVQPPQQYVQPPQQYVQPPKQR